MMWLRLRRIVRYLFQAHKQQQIVNACAQSRDVVLSLCSRCQRRKKQMSLSSLITEVISMNDE